MQREAWLYMAKLIVAPLPPVILPFRAAEMGREGAYPQGKGTLHTFLLSQKHPLPVLLREKGVSTTFY